MICPAAPSDIPALMGFVHPVVESGQAAGGVRVLSADPQPAPFGEAFARPAGPGGAQP